MSPIDVETKARQGWMSLLAKASTSDLATLWAKYDATPEHNILRAPEVGSVMVQGRQGAVGSGFNLGEITVTRCSVRLSDGTDGHAYVQGRDKNKALQAALIDALMQTSAAEHVQSSILEPLSRSAAETRKARAEKAAATKVDFFTLARGED